MQNLGQFTHLQLPYSLFVEQKTYNIMIYAEWFCLNTRFVADKSILMLDLKSTQNFGNFAYIEYSEA